MVILVTGGAGFIGSHIADALIEEGHSVHVLDNLSSGKKEKHFSFFKELSQIPCNFTYFLFLSIFRTYARTYGRRYFEETSNIL